MRMSFITSFAFIWLGLASLTTPFETMSQSVTMPTGLSFSIMTMLPIFSSFIFFAISLTVSLGDAEITGLFMMSLTRTRVVMCASACSLTGFFTTHSNRILGLITFILPRRLLRLIAPIAVVVAALADPL